MEKFAELLNLIDKNANKYVLNNMISKFKTKCELPNIIHINGPRGSGKTTLCKIFYEHIKSTDAYKTMFINCIDSYNEKDTFNSIMSFLSTAKTTTKFPILIIDDFDNFSETFVKKIVSISKTACFKFNFVLTSIKQQYFEHDMLNYYLLKTPVIYLPFFKKHISNIVSIPCSLRIIEYFKITKNLRKSLMFIKYFVLSCNTKMPSFFELSGYFINDLLSQPKEKVIEKIRDFLLEKYNNNEHVKDAITMIENQFFNNLDKNNDFLESALDLCNETRNIIQLNKEQHEIIFSNFIDKFCHL